MVLCAPHGLGCICRADCRPPGLSADRVLTRSSRACKRVCESVFEFARAIEAEVRKQDEALIQQMLEAIEAETSDTWECNSYHPKLYDAAVAARARLGNT